MYLSDKELDFLFHELSAALEGAHMDKDEDSEVERIATFEHILDKIADEQIRRQGKREAKKESRTHPSKWDRFTPGSAMDLLMQKINRDRQAAG